MQRGAVCTAAPCALGTDAGNHALARPNLREGNAMDVACMQPGHANYNNCRCNLDRYRYPFHASPPHPTPPHPGGRMLPTSLTARASTEAAKGSPWQHTRSDSTFMHARALPKTATQSGVRSCGAPPRLPPAGEGLPAPAERPRAAGTAAGVLSPLPAGPPPILPFASGCRRKRRARCMDPGHTFVAQGEAKAHSCS